MTAWRDSITVHPPADTFPMMSDGELKELAEDIKKNGQREPVVFVEIDGERTLIDGRNRLAACAMVGVKPWATTATELKDDAAIWAFIISHNVHRRHLTPEERQKRLEAVITANPEKSDREIAREAKLPNHKQVGRTRKKLESTGKLVPVAKRTGKDGKDANIPEHQWRAVVRVLFRRHSSTAASGSTHGRARQARRGLSCAHRLSGPSHWHTGCTRHRPRLVDA
jgi:ParB-like chromosome segregation protein Spo0J